MKKIRLKNKEDKNIPAQLINDTFAYLESQPYKEVKALLDRWSKAMNQEVPVEPEPDGLKQE